MKSTIVNGVLIELDENDLIDGHFECFDVHEVGINASIKCHNLKTVKLPNAIKIGAGAFAYCAYLTHVNLPRATSIGEGVFFNCINLNYINLPQAIKITSSAFVRCISLTVIDLPLATTVSFNGFSNCISLTHVNLPRVVKIDDEGFANCKQLNCISLAQAAVIEKTTFYKCDNLNYLIFSDNMHRENIHKLIKNLPKKLSNIKIIIQSEQIKSLCLIQAILNQYITQDIHPLILNYTKQLGFFKQKPSPKAAPFKDKLTSICK